MRGPMSFASSSTRSSPRSLMGATTSLAPFSWQSICHGTMLEWCSMAVMSTSSPGPTRCLPKVKATRLMASVVPRTKMISEACFALRKRRTRSRAPSYAAVARSERKCTPRWTLAFSWSKKRAIDSTTWRGFCVVAALSR